MSRSAVVASTDAGTRLSKTWVAAGCSAAILFVLVVVVSRQEINGGPLPKREQAQTDVYDLANEFHVACLTGPRPASLDALIANRSKDRQWPGPPRLGPWGEPYVIRLLPGGDERNDEIVSSGPDRVLGTDDDLRARIWGGKSRR